MPDLPDLEARNLFQAGRYADALPIYRRLYAETHHPTYLRNIGRCHQMMREPRPAIENFRAYLREARNLDPGERTEIDGYIAEMQRLEVAAPPPLTSAAPPGTALTAGTSSSSGGITSKWWFWTGLGALAVTGVIVAVAASSRKDRLPCPSGAMCPP
jgi:tetratricopeptide (TPR) repeat protein